MSDFHVELDNLGGFPDDLRLDYVRSPQGGMTGEGEFEGWGEHPDVVATISGLFRGDESGLRVVHFLGNLLHFAIGQVSRVSEDHELVA